MQQILIDMLNKKSKKLNQKRFGGSPGWISNSDHLHTPLTQPVAGPILKFEQAMRVHILSYQLLYIKEGMELNAYLPNHATHMDCYIACTNTVIVEAIYGI